MENIWEKTSRFTQQTRNLVGYLEKGLKFKSKKFAYFYKTYSIFMDSGILNHPVVVVCYNYEFQ